jgi:hypothetical protein
MAADRALSHFDIPADDSAVGDAAQIIAVVEIGNEELKIVNA